jgi:hypothetical protein
MIEITAKTPHLQQVKIAKVIEEKLLKTDFPPRSNESILHRIKLFYKEKEKEEKEKKEKEEKEKKENEEE